MEAKTNSATMFQGDGSSVRARQGEPKKKTDRRVLSSFLVICARHKQKSLCLDSRIRLLTASQRLWLPVAANTGGAKTAETGSDGGKDEQRDHVSRRWVVCSSQTGGAKKEDRPKGLSSFLVICARHKQKSLCLDSRIRLLTASQRLWLPVAANTGGAKTAETGSDGGQRRTARPCFKEMGRLFEPDRGSQKRRQTEGFVFFFGYLCQTQTEELVFGQPHPAVNCFAATVAAGGSKHRRCEDRRNRERWRQRRTARPCFKEMGRLFELDRRSKNRRQTEGFVFSACQRTGILVKEKAGILL